MKKSIVFTIIAAGLICASGCNASKPVASASAGSVEFDCTLTLPSADGSTPNIGVAGPFAGVIGNHLLVAGGANFPEGYPWDGGKKKWHSTLYVHDLNTHDWKIYPDFLDTPLAYGLSIQQPHGIILIGGNNATKVSTDVDWLTIDAAGVPKLEKNRFPSLPYPLTNSAGALVGNKIYLAGGVRDISDERASHSFLMLDLDNPSAGWKELSPWPGAPLGFAVAAGTDKKFYLFGGRDFAPGKPIDVHSEGYCYDTDSGTWSQLPGEFQFMAGTARAIGTDIWFFGGVHAIIPGSLDHPGFSNEVCRYDTASGKLQCVATSPCPITVTTVAVPMSDGVIIASGEVKPGIRTPSLLRICLPSGHR